MDGASILRLKEVLDSLYESYDFKERIIYDPIEFPHQYERNEDIEVSAFISSIFAYGKVELFKPIVEKIHSIIGKSPYDFIRNFNILKHKGFFRGLKYRFNKEDDIICLIFALSEVIKKYGSLKSLFYSFYSPSDEDIKKGLSGFLNSFLSIDTYKVYGKNIKPKGFLQFFPSIDKGSACKRMNLFLRWMVRDRDIDFGLWKKIKKDKLIIPLDAHIARISRCIGLTNRTSQDWKTAKEITQSLKRLDPEDPLKYDFSLCHQGISKICSIENCSNCFLRLRL